MIRSRQSAPPLAAMLAITLAPWASGQPCEPGWSDAFSSAWMHPEIRALAVFDDDGPGPRPPAIYAGGRFNSSFGPYPDRIARLEQGRWVDVGAGVEDGAVLALAVFDEDGPGPLPPALFAGGVFSTIGGKAINGLARWDGAEWSSVGGGVVGNVNALLVADLDGPGGAPATLYVGGSLSEAGGSPVSNIARWDGAAWSDVGGGVNDRVDSLTLHTDSAGTALIAGGRFGTAGGQLTGLIARWDGAAWSRIAGGIFGSTGDSVYALASFDPDGAGPRPQTLVAGGDFTTAGGRTVSNIAQFDGAQWAPMEGGLRGEVRSMAVFDEDDAGPAPARLFIGGSFNGAWFASGAIDERLERIVRWNGDTWSAVGDEIDGGTVYDLLEFDLDGAGPAPPVLAAGGAMTFASTRFQEYVILQWDGADWIEPAGGLSGAGRTLASGAVGSSAAPAIYVGGEFLSSGGVKSRGLAAWDGGTFSKVGPELNGPVHSLAVLDPDGEGPDPVSLLVGGSFTKAGIINAVGIARWDGAFWWPLGIGVDAPPRAFAVFDEDGPGGESPALFVGGDFGTAGSAAAPAIARWQDRGWSALAGALDSPFTFPSVHDLVVFDDGRGEALFVAGHFTTAGEVESPGIARWDGTAWSAVGDGMSIVADHHRVSALAVYDDGSGPALYAAGRFTIADGRFVNNIARWDGAGWAPLAGGIQGGSRVEVTDLVVIDLDGAGPAAPVLLAVGEFTGAGGASVANAAIWDGAAWAPVAGGGLDGRVSAAAPLPEAPGFVVTGNFAASGEVAAARLAAWHGCEIACYADCDGSGSLDFFDFLCFQDAFAAGEPSADCDGSGSLDFFDFLCFQDEFGRGCP